MKILESCVVYFNNLDIVSINVLFVWEDFNKRLKQIIIWEKMRLYKRKLVNCISFDSNVEFNANIPSNQALPWAKQMHSIKNAPRWPKALDFTHLLKTLYFVRNTKNTPVLKLIYACDQRHARDQRPAICILTCALGTHAIERLSEQGLL